ncbi:MAG: NADH-quinone oxidoreductase subunit M [Caldilineaceae bacterium]
MILVWLIAILVVGGLLAWWTSRWNPVWARGVTLLALTIDLVLVLLLWILYGVRLTITGEPRWLVEFSQPWIPQFGISFHLAMDGLSLLLVVLTLFLGILAVLASWREIETRVGFFHFNLLWILAGIVGVFLALDLFLFYFFWELMLVPMYILIAVWGHERRAYAAVKFFLFTQFSGLLMLLAILGLYYIHGRDTGIYTFDYTTLLGTQLTPTTAMWLMGGFLAAFLVKLPAVPFHTWLPDAHTEAPTAGSVILAGLLLKTGAYGLLRFVIPFFPDAAADFAPVAMFLGGVGILYGAILAFAQTDLKRLVAYTSVSHMGFVLLGVFAGNELAWQGVVMQMLCHGVSTGALFILAGTLQERMHTRDMRRMGGLWRVTPGMGAVALIFGMASLGLPGLGNFVAEFLILLGAYRVNVPLTVLAVLGLVAAAIYALWMLQRTFYGTPQEGVRFADFAPREWVVMGALIVVIVWLGIYPQPILDTARPALQALTTAPSTAVVVPPPAPGHPNVLLIFHQEEK